MFRLLIVRLIARLPSMSVISYLLTPKLLFSKITYRLLLFFYRFSYIFNESKFLIHSSASWLKKIHVTTSPLICLYDLNLSCPSFNVLEALSAYSIFSRGKFASFHFVIIKPSMNLVNSSPSAFTGFHKYSGLMYRLENLVLPCASLFPACSGVSVLDSIDDYYHIFGSQPRYPLENSYQKFRFFQPINLYDYSSYGAEAACLRPSLASITIAQRLVGQIKGDKEIVTITIRVNEYDSIRNSSLCEWAKFVEYSSTLGYFVIVIPDSDNPGVFAPIHDEFIFPVFAYNIHLRAAIYDIALCNLGVANGPLGISTFNRRASTISLNICPDGTDYDIAAIFASIGMSPGDPYFWYNDKSLNSVLPDTFENICHCFHILHPLST